MNIEEYRTRLEEFIEALHREYYLHYSGQKELLETGASYSEFSDLFSLDRIREIQGEARWHPTLQAGCPPGDPGPLAILIRLHAWLRAKITG